MVVPSLTRAPTSERAWIAEFERAFSEARFADAARLYDERQGGPVGARLSLRAAQAHMHADPPSALRVLLRVQASRLTRGERIVRDTLLAEAFARTKDFDSADRSLASALASAKELGDGELLSLVGYRYVRRYLLAEKPAEARDYLKIARSDTSHSTQVYALYAETLILPYEERVQEQALKLVELLRLLDPKSGKFNDLRAWATHTLAGLAREFPVPGASAEVERQLGGTPWPSDFSANLFQTLKALAWSKALRGDYFSAFRLLKAAVSVTPTEAWRVVAACDRSYLARAFGELRWSRVELEDTEELAQNVDWSQTKGEERIGLLLLAELTSTFDASRSAAYLARYRELSEIRSPLHYAKDARLGAFGNYSSGIVEIALGNHSRGVSDLQKALEVFERFGYDFRAARCLIAEYEVRGHSELLERAREKLRGFEQSWLAAQLRSKSNPEVSLPPMQRQVLQHMCRGESSAQIAKALGRSHFTVNNHIKQIFKAFGVNSRAALLARALRKEYD